MVGVEGVDILSRHGTTAATNVTYFLLLLYT
jgi:hypothetical protein